MALWLRRLALVLLLGVIVFAVTTARVISRGETAMKKSDAAFDAGKLRDAIVEARLAAILYAPGAPHVDAAYERLNAIALGAEATGERAIAEQAWRAVRAAALETRHAWVHRADDLERANRNLARLGKGPGVRDEAGEDKKLTEPLYRDDTPRAGYVLLLAVGFLLTGGGLGLTAARGIRTDGSFSFGQLRWGVALTMVGLACWTIAVYRA